MRQSGLARALTATPPWTRIICIDTTTLQLSSQFSGEKSLQHVHPLSNSPQSPPDWLQRIRPPTPKHRRHKGRNVHRLRSVWKQILRKPERGAATYVFVFSVFHLSSISFAPGSHQQGVWAGDTHIASANVIGERK